MNKEIVIKVPLSTANLACGFDSFGLALNLYNTYKVSISSKMEEDGFSDKFKKPTLCMEAYLETFKLYNKQAKNVKIELDQNIPNCGGLGSSANVIIAGVTSALYMMGEKLDKDVIAKIACDIEGHPDNVVPEVYGGLTSVIKEDNAYYHFKYEVSDKLHFTLLCPDFSNNTKEMRKCLSKNVSLDDAIYNLSRSANLAKAMNDGDFESLKFILKDKLHQNARIAFIKNGVDIFDEAKSDGYIPLISGSGASILIVSDKEIDKAKYEAKFSNFKAIELDVDREGLTYECK